MAAHAEIARKLDDAMRNARAVAQGDGTLKLADAYTVQELLVAERIRRGERLAGVKMGFTSRAKMVQMGVHDLIWGRLTDAMQLEDGGTVAVSRFIHPRIEPEIAFLLAKPLSGPVSLLEAGAAVAAVAPALEIIDSRYENFKFSLEDVVADNSSSAAFVIGSWRPADGIANRGMAMSFGGRMRHCGSTAAILGDPLRSLAAASRLAGAAGMTLEPGFLVLAGAATAAEPLAAGDAVSLEAEGLGRVDIRAVEA
jgi:2-oxo-3-hexenedioate decarboxylase